MDEMTTAEAAAVLGCSQAHVGRLIKHGTLAARAITRRLYLVERQSVESYAQRQFPRGWKRGKPRKPVTPPVPDNAGGSRDE